MTRCARVVQTDQVSARAQTGPRRRLGGMAQGVEIRLPLVDIKTLQSLAPAIMGIVPGGGKTALANAPTAPLPNEIVSQAKTGFGVPTGAGWMRSPEPIDCRQAAKIEAGRISVAAMVAVGSGRPGHDRVIDAIPELVAVGHDACMIIDDDDDDNTRLETLAREVGVSGASAFPWRSRAATPHRDMPHGRPVRDAVDR